MVANNSQDFVYTQQMHVADYVQPINFNLYMDRRLTAPVIASVPTSGPLGCNPTLPTCDAGDNC
ncbi:MAG: hypothetical protein IPI46_01275 [Bacteroidetes bacterium]|nr:hypothetical protein [Bacteroidota bacterium]